MTASEKFTRVLRSGDLGFVVVVIVAYISAVATAGYAPRGLTPFRLTLLITTGFGFLFVGTYFFDRCRRTTSRKAIALYFVVQIGLAATIIYLLPSGAIFLIALPLAGQAVVLLEGRLMTLLCGILWLMMVLPIWFRGGIVPAMIVGMIFLAGIVFVVVFTKIAVNERQSRAEVERLATELRDANSKLREYAAQVEELATARERNRLAREIHDSLGHYLTVVNVQIEAARAVIDDRSRSLDVLRKAQSLTQEGLAEVRRSVASLRSNPSQDRPLEETLVSLVEECRTSGIDAELIIQGKPFGLSSQVQLTVYRAAQEGLTNIKKHSHASHATVTLQYGIDQGIRLVVGDDGIGKVDVTEGGFGLLGVRERAQLLGGQLKFVPSSGGGFAFEVQIPNAKSELQSDTEANRTTAD